MVWLSRLVCWLLVNSDRKAGYLGWYVGRLVNSDRKTGYLGWYAGR